MMKLDDIKPALVNFAKLIKQDPEFMRLRPIVVDGSGMILGGNQRYRAITEKLGMEEIPDDWIVQADNLSEEQRKRFVVVDNSPDGLSGTWDFEILEEDWDVPTMEDWGFEVGGMGGLLTEDGTPLPGSGVEKTNETECPKCGFKYVI